MSKYRETEGRQKAGEEGERKETIHPWHIKNFLKSFPSKSIRIGLSHNPIKVFLELLNFPKGTPERISLLEVPVLPVNLLQLPQVTGVKCEYVFCRHV